MFVFFLLFNEAGFISAAEFKRCKKRKEEHHFRLTIFLFPKKVSRDALYNLYKLGA